MTLVASTVTVAASATQLLAVKTSRKWVVINNGDAAAIFIGPSTVATTTGIPIAAGASLTIEAPRDALFAISAAGTSANAVRLLETNG
jgi:formate hydrogenlyase subunit 3/multisubunit Na+/H+ antiporter MnhD subunit